MTEMIFHLRDGSTRSLDAQAGQTIMQVAVQGNVRGIDAECGGACACATCHVYIGEETIGRLPAPDAEELGMLEGVAAERRAGSRLACQVTLTDDIETIHVEIPDCQF
ncbi:2Fe-2S iron-sulfur cluster-binding protein [Gluconobacter wancherniae]|uniref:2Fe-2S iron-sulfur cluster-binding protein n=1 Tax=Gluconobacter wancherniae TaxID=1307955 RepID=UPI001B8D7135|nr:2Fe-2S iron-sulfur cluster-binding protein [Gluconobacter wancherniae]MBS1089914.1 2Fe-2S iron-sulfur cluster binding domain-containing protein [Gluconobacter wancherniae]